MADIIVIGAGSIGRMTSLELLNAGHNVTMIANDLPGESIRRSTLNSCKAAGIGCFFKPSSQLVAELVLESYRDFMRLAKDPRFAPISPTKLRVVMDGDKYPDWANDVDNYTVLDEFENLAQYDTYSFDPNMLGRWRIAALKDHDNFSLIKRDLSDAEIDSVKAGEKLKGSDYTVLAMGMKFNDIDMQDSEGAELSVYPIRGMLIHYPQAESKLKTPYSFMNEHGEKPSYIVRRPGGITVGGTYEEYIDKLSSKEEGLKIKVEIMENALEQFHDKGLNTDDFKLPEAQIFLTDCYRPGHEGGPMIDIGDSYKGIAVLNGWAGQGYVPIPAAARRIVRVINKKLSYQTGNRNYFTPSRPLVYNKSGATF